jgi:ADP-heptose:LPS heptosyltransferase
VAEALRRKFPDSHISYLAAAGPAGIRSLAPYVDSWLTYDSTTSRGIFSLRNLIRGRNFDCAIELKPSLHTAAAALLSGIRLRIGTARRGYSFLYNERVNVHRKGAGKHQTDLDLELLAPLGINESGNLPELSITHEAIEKGERLMKNGSERFVVMHPGSGGSAPNWRLENFKKLATMIIESTGWGVVITGNKDNIGIFDERCVDLNGKTELDELAGVITRADLFISGSTGPLHLADALGVKCMAFFARHAIVGPERWGPRRNMNNILMPDAPCKCTNLANCQCLQRISPEKALERATELFSVK